jgi:hypothetical protein
MKPNTYLAGACVVLFLMVILFGVLLGISTNEMNKASDRIDQLIKIKQLLDTRGKTDTADLSTVTTKSLEQKSLDQETTELVVNYSAAQDTYITLLQGLLRNNGVQFPEFEYGMLLEEVTIQ